MSNKYDEILNLCAAKNDTPEWINSPFICNDYVIATNRYVFVYFNKEFAEEKYKLNQKTNVLIYINQSCNINLNIEVSELEKAIEPYMEDEFISVGDDIKCKCCNGDGTVEWNFSYNNKDYEQNFDCPVCKGSGMESESRMVKNGLKTPDLSKTIIIKNSWFSAKYIYTAIRCCKMLGVDKFTLVYQDSERKGSVFQIKDIKLLIMPTLTQDNEENIIYKR